jgi:hypothetical protein
MGLKQSPSCNALRHCPTRICSQAIAIGRETFSARIQSSFFDVSIPDKKLDNYRYFWINSEKADFTS